MGGFAFSLAGLVVGTTVGATGVGGGSLMTPILILFYGVSPTLAVGTDLLYASASKAFGVLLYRNHGSVDWKIVGWQALGSIPAVLLTLFLVSYLGKQPGLDQLIKYTLSIAVITTATFTLLQDRLQRMLGLHDFQNRIVHPGRQRVLTIASGVLIGTVVTISSVGAGAIGMMLLLLLYPRHLPVKLVGSDLAHAVLITAIAGAGHARLGTVDYSMLLFLLLGAIPGIWLGSMIGFRLNAAALKKIISYMLIVVGAMTLYKAIVPGHPAAPAAATAAVPDGH